MGRKVSGVQTWVLPVCGHTAGKPAQMRLTTDRALIQADGADLSYVLGEVLDADGKLVPDANALIHVEADGSGFIAGTDNGDQNDPNGLKRPERHAFYGKAMAVVQSNGQAGVIHLTASAEGLPITTVAIQAK